MGKRLGAGGWISVFRLSDSRLARGLVGEFISCKVEYTVSRVYRALWLLLNPEEPTFLGFLIMISLYKSLKGRFFRVKAEFTA